MLRELLTRSASSFPARPALVEGDRVLTYRQMLDVVQAVEAYLRDRGVGSGGAVALQVPNSIEFVIALFAVGRLGAAALLLDPTLKAGEVDRHCMRAGATAILCRSTGGNEIEDGGLRRYSVPPMDVLCEWAARTTGHPQADRPPRHAQQNVLLFLSSGTMGPPKIVPKTAAQAQAALQIFCATLPYCQEDRVLASLPFFHSFGQFNVLLATLAAGATLHVEPFSPRRTAAAIERDRITVLPATPFMFRLLTETEFQQAPDFSSVRLAISAGSALSAGIARRFEEKFAVPIAQSYGTTETGPVTVALPAERVDEPGWVGRPYSDVRVEIWGPSGNVLEPGREGEIAVRSRANASCYLDGPAASALTFRQGYVLTGDIGCLNEAEHLLVLGRKKPMLNVAGKKVSPSEVEACLRGHPSVAEVLVVGTALPDGDERVKALVVPAGQVTAVELQEFCGSRLADFKVPRQIVFVENLSRGPMGKPPGQSPPP